MDERTRHSLPEEWATDLPDGTVFRAAFEASTAVMFLLDPLSGRLIGANPAACEYYGYTPAELSCLDLTDVSLLPRERIQEILHGLNMGGPTRYSSRHRLKNGQLRDVEMEVTPLTLQSGRSCLFFIGHDVTARVKAERDLRQREGLLRAILESAGDGIAFRDANGVYREVNPAFCRMSLLPCGEVMGRRGQDIFDRRSLATHVEMDRRVAEEHTPVTYEITQETAEGPRHISVHKAPVLDALGECLGMVSVSRDITKDRNAEAALRRSEGLLRAMLQAAQDSIFVTDAEGVVRELNQAFCEHMGRGDREMLDRPLEALFSGEELRQQLSTSALARETLEPVRFIQRMQLPGQELWLSVVKSAMLDPEGRFLGVVSMGRDITAQRRAELALRQSERRLSSLVRQAPVGVFETDTAGGLVFSNERMQRQTGSTQQELAGQGWTRRIAPEDRQDFLAAWKEALAGKREMERELRVLDGRGQRLWVSCRLRPMTDAGSRFGGYLGVLVDVSERKKAEALRNDVESVVRHDLKSPLGSVQNALELLEMLGPVNPEQAQVLAEMRALTRRMLGLISLSLDMHAMELGAFRPKLTPVDVCDVAEEQVRELRLLMEGKRLRLAQVSDCPQEPFWVRGERRLLDAMFSNLLRNAAEAAPAGSEISLTMRREGPEAVVALRNQGEVPLKIRERFFEKYATAGKLHGTGLGAYSARLMARTMGGALTVDCSEPGATTLTLRLPASPPPEA